VKYPGLLGQLVAEQNTEVQSTLLVRRLARGCRSGVAEDCYETNLQIYHTNLDMLHLGLWFRAMLSNKFSLFSSSLHRSPDSFEHLMRATLYLFTTEQVQCCAHEFNEDGFIWTLYVKGDCNSFKIAKSIVQ